MFKSVEFTPQQLYNFSQKCDAEANPRNGIYLPGLGRMEIIQLKKRNICHKGINWNNKVNALMGAVCHPESFVILNEVKNPQPTRHEKKWYCKTLMHCSYVADPSLHSG